MPASQEIKVESYSDVAWRGAWFGRATGMFGCALLGVVFGAAIGAVAALAPMLFVASVPLAWGLVGTSAGIFAALGMTLGFGVGASVGAPAGAAAAAEKERERRDREAGVLADDHGPTAPQKEYKTFNFKVGVAVTLIGLAAGAIMAGGFILSAGAASGVMLPMMKVVLGPAVMSASATAVPAITAYCMGVMGGFGALWFFNFSKLTNGARNLMAKIMDGSALGTTWEKAPSPQLALQPAQPVALPALEAASQATLPEAPERRFAASLPEPAGSYQALAVRPAAPSAGLAH